MKSKIKYLFIIFMYFNVIIYAAPPVIEHTPIIETQESIALTITAIITDEDGIKNANLYFKTSAKQFFQMVEMTQVDGIYNVIIEGGDVIPPVIEYYIEAVDKLGNKSFHPRQNYLTKPHSIKVKEMTNLEKLKPSGNYTITYRTADATSPAKSQLPLDLMAVQPTSILNYNFNSLAIGKNRNYTLWINRDSELYTDRTRDKFRFTINTKKVIYTIGDFYASFSELSFPGGEIRGLGVKSNLQKNNSYVIVGSSQRATEESAKFSPVYRQYFVGLRQELNLSKKILLSLNIASNYDDDTSIAKPQRVTLLPTKDISYSAEFKQAFKENVFLLSEYAKNVHDEDMNDGISATKSRAYKIGFQTAVEKLDMDIAYKNIDSKFFTAATLFGSTTTNKKGAMDNNKKGIFSNFEYRPVNFIALSSGIDKYSEVSPSAGANYKIKTEDKKLSVSFMPEKIPGVSLRTGKLTRESDDNGLSQTSSSKTTGYGTNYNIPSLGAFGNTKFSYNKQKIDFKNRTLTSNLSLKIDMDIFSFETAFKNLFVLSSNINTSNTKDLINKTTTKRDSLTLGMHLNIIPYKLTSQIGMQDIDDTKSDNSINKQEKNYNIQFNYYLTKTLILSSSFKQIKYRDKITNTNDYDENIITVKLTQTFFEITPKQKIKLAAAEKEKIEEKQKQEIKELDKTLEEILKFAPSKKITVPPAQEEKKQEERYEIKFFWDEKKPEIKTKENDEEIIEEEVEEEIVEEEEEFPRFVAKPLAQEEKEVKVVSVKSGESLQDIARIYLGDEKRYLEIIANNPELYVYVYILPGEVIEIAKDNEVMKYKIREGDTLWRIAEKYFGAGELYIEILRQNPHIQYIYTGKPAKIKIIKE